ncbi:tetratricopeptide repeat protein [Candidatus Peribacteria bacterium]|nr:tetratricopeptide repeat protein [Candidatus Peribacteria bacterium]
MAQYKKIIDLDPNSYQAYYNIGSAYLNQDNQEQALEYYRHARYSAHGKRQIQESSEAIEDLEKDIQIKNNSFSEDTFSHLQYYL